MFKPFLQPKGIRFRRFCHKAYAAFCSIHREVTIGRIAAYMTDLEMLKSGKSVAVSALLLFSGIAMAEAEEGVPKDSVPLTAQQLSLQEVLVVSHKAEVHSEAYRLITQVSHAEIEALPIQTVADILQYLPGVDVRTRGANGAQADISMRGGTFDQVLVLLNGVPLSDFHTGHYALNIPVSTELIERVEVLQGTSANLHGAFSGAINIVTKNKVQRDKVQGTKDLALKLTAGMNGLVNPELAASIRKKEALFNISAEYSRAEGYYAPKPTDKEATACQNSDFQLANIYFQTRWRGLEQGLEWVMVSGRRISLMPHERLLLPVDMSTNGVLGGWMRRLLTEPIMTGMNGTGDSACTAIFISPRQPQPLWRRTMPRASVLPLSA